MSQEPLDLGIEGLTDIERIGAGGTAVVYRARQPALDRNVVVKVLTAADVEATRRRFDRERRAMGRLSQVQGIAPVYESGYTPSGQPYLIMPFYERGSLQDRLRAQGPLSPTEVRDIGVRICRAVQTAHEHGVVHRDLKPANILMSRSGRPDVADFGIARLLDDAGGRSQALTMTPLYTAPEVFDGVDSGVATDVYSLGALLYAVLNGRPAFSDPDGNAPMLAVIRRVNEDPLPDLPSSVPPELASVIATAMSKDPAQRHPSAGAMADALEAADLVEARTSGRSLGMVIAALLVLAAAIAVALVAALVLTRGDDESVTPDPTPGPEVTAEPSPSATPPPGIEPTPDGPPIDTSAAVAVAERARVVVEGFSCTGAFVADGVLLEDGRVVTDEKILRAPWHISVTIGPSSADALPLTADPLRSAAALRLPSPPGTPAPPYADAADGDPVVVVDAGGDHVVTTLVFDGESRSLAEPAGVRTFPSVVAHQGGDIIGAAVESPTGIEVVSLDTIEQDWGRTPPLYGCADRTRDLDASDADAAVSPAIADLLRLQRLSNAYANEEWELVRELEPGKALLTDEQFVEGWRPLRQGFVYPVHRSIAGGEIRWRIGLIGHETWNGSDLTTLFCVTWTVDIESGAITQTNEDTVAVYGPQPNQPQRPGFVDPADLRVEIDRNCPSGP